ncbi:MAG: hypothetical protein AAGC56_07265 [Pseudomonadota bacterium]
MRAFVEIAHFWDPEEFVCARSRLSAYGIVSLPDAERHLAMDPVLRFALGGCRLNVLSAQADDARAALADAGGDAALLDAEYEPPRRGPKNWLWVLTFPWHGMPFVPRIKGIWRTLGQLAVVGTTVALGPYALYGFIYG